MICLFSGKQSKETLKQKMPPNSKSKFVGVSIFVTFVILCLLVAAIGTPSWKTYSTGSNDETRWGLFSMCTGSTCTKIKDIGVSQVSFTDATCTRDRNDIVDRMNATAGLIIAALVLTFLAAIPQALHAIGVTTISKQSHARVGYVLILATALSFTGVVVYGGTTSNWLGCGRDVCDVYDSSSTSCGIGYSYIFTIVGTALLALTTLLVLGYTYRPNILHPSGDVVFGVTFVSLIAIVLMAIGVGTKQWHIIVPNYIGNGLFEACTPQTCAHNQYSSTQVTTTTGCVRELKDMANYNVTAATFLIGAATIMAVFFIMFAALFLTDKPLILFTRTKKWVVIGFIVFAEVLQLTAFLLQENMYDSWLFCGTSFCSQFSGFCTFGMSYGFVITSIVLTAMLAVMHYFELHDWCCFHERFASGRHNFTFKEALETITERTPRKPLGSMSRRPAPPVPPTATAQAAAGSHEPNNNNTDVGPSSALDNTVALPPGDWEYDSVSGYYWCDQIYLFYDPETRQYYDPSTDQWINTEGGATSATVAAQRAAAAAGHESAAASSPKQEMVVRPAN
ncbi:membrane-associated protein, putative [Bodo saltans]|uniref:Membrane-associated protein, putative n=1 Tax=Bodo saltans TaxID=75058 RepID=A0A0S4J4A7_BODSA|nr:membrane-associated protein, putative [Bodo saltans]|eukprot:CUG76234.1 membrane-associated protein, putative [Bodo saltans]